MVALCTFLITPLTSPTSLHRDRFRTTVNVLGDTFGVGIVGHYSRRQLERLPPTETELRPTSSASSETREDLQDLSDRFGHLREGVRSPDYGSASSQSQYPTLPIIPTPQWSFSSSSHGVEPPGDESSLGGVSVDREEGGGVTPWDDQEKEVGGARKRLSVSSENQGKEGTDM